MDDYGAGSGSCSGTDAVKRVGRPKKSEKKTCGYRLRMTQKKADELSEMSDKTGLTKSQVIEKALDTYKKLVDIRGY